MGKHRTQHRSHCGTGEALLPGGTHVPRRPYTMGGGERGGAKGGATPNPGKRYETDQKLHIFGLDGLGQRLAWSGHGCFARTSRI